MKKFLSLLLAMTMVMSLIVLPARATGDTYSPSKVPELEVKSGETVIATTDAVAKDTNLTFKVKTDGISFTKNGSESVNDVTYSYEWSGAIVKDEENWQATESVSANSTPSMTVSCTVKAKSSGATIYTFPAITRAVTVYDLNTAIDKVYFNDRPYDVTYNASNGSATVYLGNKETLDGKWQVLAKSGYTVSDQSTNTALDGTTLKFKVAYGKSMEPVEKTISITSGTLSTPTVSITKPTGINNNTVRTDHEVVFTASGVTNKSDNTRYGWSIKKTAAEVASSSGRSTNTFTWTPREEGQYTVTCTLYEGSVVTKKTGNLTVTVEKDNTVISKFYNPTMIPNSKQPLSFTFKDKNEQDQLVDVNVSEMINLAWTISSPNPATGATITPDSKDKMKAEFAVPANAAQNYTVKASFTYKNEPYEVSFAISTQTLTATLSSVQSGGYRDYAYSELVNAAQAAITTRSTTSYGYEIVSSVSVRSQTVTNYGTFTAPSVVNGYYRFTSYGNVIGTAAVTGTVTTNRGTYSITFNIPVSPTKVAYEDQYPEPVAYGNTYRYYVQVPSGYSSYYVLGTPNQATEPNWTLTGTQYYGNNLQYYGNNLYYLTDSNFVGGKCTLWLVTKDSSNRYSCGQLTVYQKNYNINYNGVAGETVQFKHADFTNFMNEVSQARGDASKTGSYPYVTFNYVTFNYPTSTQGTLYYNGTAMSNSSYSGSFNSRTQITNLDNVTFVPYARTSAKSIPLTFTLSVTKYGANGAVVNRDLKYTGTVAVSIVREDIKYTAAPGDTIRFTDSDFLSYLRTQNGFNSNYYSIDYVTFDQSAVNALNEGVLYAYSTGFNAVKTTDKFYYTTTSYNQNALSDVTFRASAYAKTGTTVYIPFTIYARYGTTGTGTRQVSGTVAIKLAQTMNFVDVKPTDYFYDSVKWAVNSNITKGTTATTFSPYKTCTRAEIVTFLWRAAGSKTPTITRDPFTDVAPSMGMDYYYAILWASQNGIAAGTSATTFSPNDTCTRAQIVTFLWRYSNKPAGYYSNPFTDVNKAEHAAYYDAILWAVGKGTTATTFSPYGTCTRGEAVTFLYRAVNGK